VPGHQVPDLAQEVFVRLLQAGEARSVANPEAYLFTVAANLVREHAAIERAQASRHVALSDPVVAEALTQEPAAMTEASGKAMVGRLHQALRELPPIAVTAIHMAYAQERSYQEIARSLGMSKPAVGRLLQKALRHCCRRMTGAERGEGRRGEK
jgi:RNA polymerase sigma-70 factor (ECF subfamily)